MEVLEVIGCVIAGIAILALFIGIAMANMQADKINSERIKAEQSCLYKAWAKETGNVNNLTEDEFIVLYVHRNSWSGGYKVESKVNEITLNKRRD